MTTHSIRIKAIVLSIVFILCVVIVPQINVNADSFPSEFFVNSEVYYSPEEMYYAYIDLNSTQRDICSYILGMYNLMYLGSRGFEFKAGAYRNESEFIAKIRAFGYRLFQSAAEVSFKSRMDADFCKYASACILYSSQCNVADFDTWFDNLDSDFVLPLDQGLLNSFVLLYDDNSNLGVSSFGDIQTPWNSGIAYNWQLTNYPFNNATQEGYYTSFINDYQYIMYTNVVTHSSGNPAQFLIGLNISSALPDSIYLVKDSNYQVFRYGYHDHHTASNYNLEVRGFRVDNGKVYCHYRGSGQYFTVDLQPRTTTNFSSDLSDRIEEIFNLTPFTHIDKNIWLNSTDFEGFYPLVSHVFLVDDINTLANPVEVFNTDSWDVVGVQNNMIVPIDKVGLKPKILTTIDLPDNTNNDVNIKDMINDDNVVDDNGDPVDPWNITVIVQPNDTNPISVSVNLFTGAKSYVKYLWESSKKFIQYCSNLLDCFEYEDAGGDLYGPKIAIFGVVTLGIAGGLIAKFLL